MRSRPGTLFLDDQLVIVSLVAAAAAFNEYFSGRDYWRRPLRATLSFFKAKPTRHARDLMVKENKSRTRVEEAIKNSFILNNCSCRFERSENVCVFYFFKGPVSEERWRSGEGCGANNHMHLVKLQCKVVVSQTFFFFFQ